MMLLVSSLKVSIKLRPSLQRTSFFHFVCEVEVEISDPRGSSGSPQSSISPVEYISFLYYKATVLSEILTLVVK